MTKRKYRLVEEEKKVNGVESGAGARGEGSLPENAQVLYSQQRFQPFVV